MLKHLRKNWICMLSTVPAMSVCIFLFCTLQTVIEAVNFGPAQRPLEAAHNSTLRQPRVHLAAKLQGEGCRHSRRYYHCRLPNFGLSPQITAIGIGIALVLGLVAGFFPALTAYRARIVDMLRQM